MYVLIYYIIYGSAGILPSHDLQVFRYQVLMCQADCLAASVGVRMEKLHAVYITVCIIYIYIYT